MKKKDHVHFETDIFKTKSANQIKQLIEALQANTI